MKTTILTTLLMMAISFIGFAQQEVVQDFESSPAVAGFEGLASATIVSDPSSAGNGLVFELVTSTAGNPWQGAEVVLADNSALDLTSDLTVSIDVWSNIAFSPMVKVETTGSAAAAPFSANTQSHTGSGWETLTFTFNTGDDNTATADGVYNKVVFFPNRSSDGTAWNDPIIDGTFYFDNITGVKGTITSPPSGQQEVVQDFESSPSVTGFEGLASATIVSDPSSAGNGQVFELVTSTAGNPWQGAEVVLADNSALDLTSDLTVSVDVWSNVAFSPMAKVETTGSAEAAPFSANTQSHTGSGWETLTFTFNTGDDNTATANGIYNKVVFFPNRSSDGTAWNDPIIDGTFYFDNITGVKGTIDSGTISTPTEAAPTPPNRDAGDVISIYSDAYTNTGVSTYIAGFSQGSYVGDDEIATDDFIKLYNIGNFIAIRLENGIDLTNYTHMHFDFWIADASITAEAIINPKLSNHAGLPETAGETNAIGYVNPVSTIGQWVSFDIPLDDFTSESQNGLLDRENIYEILFTTGGSPSNVYFDNIYFYKDVATSIDGTDELPNNFTLEQNYPNPFNPITNISYTLPANAEVTLEVFNVAGQRVATLVDAFQSTGSYNVTFDASNLASGLYTYRLTTGNSVQVKKMMLIK